MYNKKLTFQHIGHFLTINILEFREHQLLTLLRLFSLKSSNHQYARDFLLPQIQVKTIMVKIKLALFAN